MLKKIIHSLISFASCYSETIEERRDKETLEVEQRSIEIAKIYELPENCDLLEITDKVLRSPLLSEENKQTIIVGQRKIFLFAYPSDNLVVKGFISFVSHPEKHSTVVLLRGGCKEFGLLMPGLGISTLGDFTVISTTYRDGVSEGCDEFGGNDVNDIKNLIDFIPTLEIKLARSLQNKKLFMLGGSRGAMQLFLTMARFPEIQDKVAKVISLSGMLDMEIQLRERSDMKRMFIENFGMLDEKEWIATRNPILTVPYIKKDLPILIIQGSDDIRVFVQEARHMVQELKEHGCQVEYWEIEGGDHDLSNLPNRNQKLIDWLENND